ncbi:MAG: pyridoxamine 5'-phosphate oxidase [Candidatus Dormibacteraeota bacterium]|uniref:Pyridoxamine 5'-phosphate oxidase n=1 Tax=Candidatus Dormiibacter inghamiae TaxID=3127013 RepID=A0A934KD35_9BACT|nr:pyridoxamine 5'-phosphate oxidase [Candidatus Dormibacteraeota bacterium]MBJ7605633.1 pyridoxamine 5'-phosphate oxidase [Candidatus Dormibacteraeota bacterium]
MLSWRDLELAEPELASAAGELFRVHKHHVLATLRRNGSPRLSGQEVGFSDGELWFGVMGGALRARDLQRDGRFELHTSSTDPPNWTGDAKLAGLAEEITDPEEVRRAMSAQEQVPPGSVHLFRCRLAEVVLTRLGEPADHLVLESWREGRGVLRRERR